MSGTFRYRVNRSWNKAFSNISAAVFFWEWLQFFNDHPNYSFVGYGTGKTQSGTTPPASWFDWEPDVSGTPPWSDNSWFVINADLSSALIDGSGSEQWQAKFQVTLATVFDDCNVADVDYDWEGTDYCCCVRASAAGGWNGTTLDFAPTGGEEASHNFNIFEDTNNYFGLDIVSDDDTIFWRGAVVTSSLLSEGPTRSRGGYLGMTQRKHSGVVNPFLFVAGRLFNELANAGYRSINSCYDNNQSYYAWRAGNVLWDGTTTTYSWPSYSIWSDGSEVRIHKVDTWDKISLINMTPDVFGDSISWAMKVAQWVSPDRYAILGELRLVAKTGFEFGHGTIFGDNNEWLQFCYGGDVYSGVGMRWPQSIVPIW